ncbi:MAG: DegT/DnrJ/EryC1/StrS family aminotransferase [Chitinophagales bacterium]
MNIQMVDLKGQYQGIKETINQGIQEVLDSCWFINGPQVKRFSKNLGDYLNLNHVTPCGNGTDALQIALMALDLQPGDEIITTAFTFVATAEVAALLNLHPVFVDIERDTFNIDPAKIEAAITPRTKCIIPVHLYGQCANMEAIMDIANKHDLYVIEDNAQAIGADYTLKDGTVKKSGAVGHIGCTSFYPSKNLGAYGDAGAVFTNCPWLGKKIHLVANHGQSVKYEYTAVGINSRLDSFQAVVLDAKLAHLNQYIAARQAAAAFYDTAFADFEPLTIPHRAAYSTHVFHQYTLTLQNPEKREALRTFLKEKGIPSMIYYPFPLHTQKAYTKYRTQVGDLPITEELVGKVISLPMHTELTEEQLQYIVTNVKSFWS